jgi:hypothetical protein
VYLDPHHVPTSQGESEKCLVYSIGSLGVYIEQETHTVRRLVPTCHHTLRCKRHPSVGTVRTEYS